MGLKNKDGTWTGQWGIQNDDDFLSNRNHVQDRALEAYMRRVHGYTRSSSNDHYVGQQIELPDWKDLRRH